MTRLEFVSMSLSKGLKGVISIDGEQEIVTLKSIDTDGNEIWVSSDNWVYSSLNYDIKIICRTLSNLTKEIEHSGEMFVPIQIIAPLMWNIRKKEDVQMDGLHIIYHNAILGKLDMKTMPLNVAQKLIEWKFNLMDENEPFIDVNTIDVNPYK